MYGQLVTTGGQLVIVVTEVVMTVDVVIGTWYSDVVMGVWPAEVEPENDTVLVCP